MMKMIQSLFSYRFPLASPASARPCTLPDAFTHCRKWARVGFPLGTHHTAARLWITFICTVATVNLTDAYFFSNGKTCVSL